MGFFLPAAVLPPGVDPRASNSAVGSDTGGRVNGAEGGLGEDVPDGGGVARADAGPAGGGGAPLDEGGGARPRVDPDRVGGAVEGPEGGQDEPGGGGRPRFVEGDAD